MGIMLCNCWRDTTESFCSEQEKQVEQDNEGVMHDMDIVPSESDVYDDFDMIRRELGIKSWQAKWVKRK